MTYILGGQIFDTLTNIKTHTTDILRYASVGTEVTGAAKTFLLDLFRCHPNAAKKFKDCAVPTIIRKKTHFDLIRDDGTSTDISHNKCITQKQIQGRPLTEEDIRRINYENLTKAARHAINDQIVEFREAFWQSTRPHPRCPVSKKIMYRGTSAVDHYGKRFADLLEAFLLTDVGRTINSDDLLTSEDNVIGVRFKDASAEKAKSWWVYHKEHAKLRMVDKPTNSGELNKGYVLKSRRLT